MEKWLFSKTYKKELHEMFTPRVQYGMNLGCRPSNGQMNEPKGRVLFFAHVVLETGAEVANLARAGNAHEDTGAGQRLQEESSNKGPSIVFFLPYPVHKVLRLEIRHPGRNVVCHGKEATCSRWERRMKPDRYSTSIAKKWNHGEKI